MAAPRCEYKLMLEPKQRLYTTPTGVEATASYRIRWADAFDFYNDVMGLRTSSTIGGAIVSSAPWGWPADPRLYAIDCSIEPLSISGSPSAGPKQGLYAGEFFEFARADVVFGVGQAGDSGTDGDPIKPMQFDPENPITWCYQDTDHRSESIQTPDGTFLWEDDNKPLPFRVQRKNSVIEMVLKFPRVPYLPFDLIDSHNDCVNAYPVLKCPVGTLLFLGAQTQSEITAMGGRSKGVTMRFAKRKRPWNELLKSSSWVRPYYTEGGVRKYLYDEKDLRNLFK